MRPRGRLAVIAWLLAGAAVVSLAACNQAGRPPRGAAGGSVAEAVDLAVDLGGGPYTVVPGDSVYLIARSLRVPIRALIEANGLAPPFRLVPGQILTIPPRSEYLVQPGDTVYGLARRFGVDQSSLIRLNDIGAPEYIIRIGQRLLIPSRVRKLASATAVAGTLAPSPSSPSPSSPSNGGAIEAVELAPAVLMPPPTPEVPVEAPAATTPDTLPETIEAAEAVPTPKVAQPPKATLEPAPLDTVVDGGAKFLWPVNGKVISRFGAKTGGLVNDGLNIAAPLGAPVRAAESGVVAYIGNELQGFGNLVLIRHADGWMSAYAHNETLLVKRGEQVKRGQTIARVGQTGSVTEPQLHFELRRGTEAVNPIPLLDRRSS